MPGIDQLATTHLEGASGYGSLTSSNGIKPPLKQNAATSHSMPDTGSPPGDIDRCNCAQSAMKMLSDLETKITNITDFSIDSILTDQNCCLVQIDSWLMCACCDSPMTTAKVIILVIDGLCSYLERVVVIYIGQVQRDDTGSDEDQLLTGICNIGVYHVNSWSEWSQTLRVLLLSRCKDLQNTVVSLQERDVLTFLLKKTEQKLTNIINQLKKCEKDLG